MEDKVLNIFDNLEIEEAERLLNCDVNVDIDKKAKDRIRKLVFKEAGFKSKQLFMSRRLFACAAAAVILITSLSFVGIDNVKAAIGQVFSFIPGYGIAENNDSINYILSDTVTTENENAILILNNAIATKYSITVMLTLQRKNYTEEQLIKDKQEEWDQLQKSDKLVHPKIFLYTNDNEYTDYTGVTAGGSIIDTFNYTYTLKPDEINKDTTYKLTYKDFNLTLEFKLKDYQNYSNLNQIGPTGYNNDISLTAVPTFIGNNVEVNLYSINKSQYKIISYNKIYYGYKGADLKLITNIETKSYSLPDGWGGVNSQYVFKVNPTDTSFTLNIPYIIVQSNEDRNISLPIPNVDQIINVNKKVKFKDSTMTIVSVERNSEGSSSNGSLKMMIKYDNKSSNLIMRSAQFSRITFWGTTQSGGYSSTMDTNDIESIVYFDLNKGEKSRFRLKISNPEYFLTDDYNLKFDRK
ncbi:MAG: hypothetical protein QM644_04575 [Mobilitalea sp.]